MRGDDSFSRVAILLRGYVAILDDDSFSRVTFVDGRARALPSTLRAERVETLTAMNIGRVRNWRTANDDVWNW
jgi:hypothetical protein